MGHCAATLDFLKKRLTNIFSGLQNPYFWAELNQLRHKWTVVPADKGWPPVDPGFTATLKLWKLAQLFDACSATAPVCDLEKNDSVSQGLRFWHWITPLHCWSLERIFTSYSDHSYPKSIISISRYYVGCNPIIICLIQYMFLGLQPYMASSMYWHLYCKAFKQRWVPAYNKKSGRT